MPVKLNSTGGGSVTLDTPSTASNYTITLPSSAGTLATTSGSLASPTITGTVAGGATYTSPTLTGASITAANSNTVEATSGPTSSQLAGNRNKIINGAMMIDQRNAGASFTVTSNNYTLDRWLAFGSVTSKYAVQQSSSAPAGFTNSLMATSLSAYSVGASELFSLSQIVEGYNISDLGFGTANAKSFTISFWVNSSLTGTFTAFFANGGQSRWYIAPITITNANTWQYVTVTVPGDTSGTWITNNGQGLFFSICLSAGSAFQSAASSGWSGSSTKYGITGQTSFVATNGATFYITGVQLEKGATATPFENRLYGTELALCQRYLEYQYARVSGPNTAITGTTYVWQFKVTKRASPTITPGTVTTGGSGFTGTVGAVNYTTESAAFEYGTNATGAGSAASTNKAECEL